MKTRLLSRESIDEQVGKKRRRAGYMEMQLAVSKLDDAVESSHAHAAVLVREKGQDHGYGLTASTGDELLKRIYRSSPHHRVRMI